MLRNVREQFQTGYLRVKARAMLQNVPITKRLKIVASEAVI